MSEEKQRKISLLGAVAIGIGGTLPWRSASDNPKACIAFFVFLLCAFLFEVGMSRFRTSSKRAWHAFR
jgi:hypothetical protein